MKDKRALIEAALFMSPNPLSTRELLKISGITSEKKLKEILDQIEEEHESEEKGFELALTGDSYHFRVKKSYLDKVATLTPHADLPGGMLRTLGLVALKQPVRQSYVVKVQGNKAYDYVKNLEKRGLIKTQKSGRTKLIETTKEFEKYFGRSLEEIKATLEDVVKDEQSGDTRANQTTEETQEFEDTES